MTTPLVYLDQNIISLQSSGKVDLSRQTTVQMVYSKEHFAEISRSNTPAPFLQALDELSAKLLDLEMENWSLTGKATLIEDGTAEQHYQKYLGATNDVTFDNTLFNPMLAWICGGGNEDLLRSVPEKIFTQLQNLLEQLPNGMTPQLSVAMQAELEEMIESVIKNGNDIDHIRHHLGVGKGAAGDITGSNPLGLLWEKISPSLPDTTAEQIFGFAPVANEQSPPLTWFGIIRCCTILDILGYKAEGKKTRNPDKIPNVLSDATHIATGAYCSAIISHDKRLVARANAIYRFLSIDTQAVYLKLVSEV